MPDRNDGIQSPDVDELGVFPLIDTAAPAGFVHTPDMFDENASEELSQYIAHGMPEDFIAENPADYYTAFVRSQRTENVVFNLYNAPNGYVVASGKRLLTGYSLQFVGATGPVYLRDGNDVSGQASVVIPTGGGTFMFGIDGILFDYGIFADYSQAGPITGIQGGLYMRRVFSD